MHCGVCHLRTTQGGRNVAGPAGTRWMGRGEYPPPEVEDRLAHLRVSLPTVMRLFGGLSAVAVVVAVYLAPSPSFVVPEPNAESTEFIAVARKAYRYYENGNGSVYFPTERGPAIIEKWFVHPIVDNMDRYRFGTTLTNYCVQRNASSNEWATSLFRASQHFAIVQVTLRFSVLILCHVMAVQTLIFAKEFYLQNQSIASLALGALSVVNEFLLSIFAFMLFEVHSWQDRSAFVVSSNFVSFVVVFSISKLLMRCCTQGVCLASLARIVGAVVVFVCYPTMANDVDSFAKDLFCDSYVSPKVALAQLATLAVMTANFLWDLHCSAEFKMVFSCTEEDRPLHWHDDEDRAQTMTAARSFLNIHVVSGDVSVRSSSSSFSE